MPGSGNSVIVVEAVKEETKGRQEEVRASVRNTGSGLREWIVEEAVWLFAQFTKVALSVAVVRGVHQLFRIGFASEAADQRAPDLWTYGHQDQDIVPEAAVTLIRADQLVTGGRWDQQIPPAQLTAAAVSIILTIKPCPRTPDT
jgi:hypothetical protein